MSNTNRQPYKYVHGQYVERMQEGMLIANVVNCDTGQSETRMINNPRRPFWVTRLDRRNHSEKLECAPERDLNLHVVPEPQRISALAKALGTDTNYKPPNERFLLSSPYVYGADIDVQAVYKKTLADSCDKTTPEFSAGHFDIEVDVNGNGEVILITYVDSTSRKVYTAIHEKWLNQKPEWNEEAIHKLYKSTAREFSDKLLPEVKKVFLEKSYELTTFVSSDEVEMIKWIMKAIHYHRPLFIGIWNIGYDIPVLFDRLEKFSVDPKTVFCHPDIPERWRECSFKFDKNPKAQKITDYWHWFRITGPTQFYDSMCLYSRVRAAKPNEVSYKLDYISGKTIGTGKLDFGQADHSIMQKERFVEYAVYNIFDTIVLDLMERKERDLQSWVGLVGPGLIENFPNQTVMLKYLFYDYCRKNKMVPGSVGKKMTREGDDKIKNIGGGVLSPALVKNSGVPVLKDSDRLTMFHRSVFDLDVTS